MYKNFNIIEILESVSSISSDNRYIEKLDMAQNRDTEKIILEAEESLNNQKSADSTQSTEPLILNNLENENEKDNNIGVVKTESAQTKDSTEKIIDNKPLILNNEYTLILDNEYEEESTDDISQEYNLEESEEEIDLKELEQEYYGDTRITFLSVSVDTDKDAWLEIVKAKELMDNINITAKITTLKHRPRRKN